MFLSNPLRCDLRSHQHHLYIRLYADLLHAFSREAHTMHGCLIPPQMPLYKPVRLNPGKILSSHHPVSHRSVLQFLSVSKLRILKSPELRLLSQPSRLLQVAARTVSVVLSHCAWCQQWMGHCESEAGSGTKPPYPESWLYSRQDSPCLLVFPLIPVRVFPASISFSFVNTLHELKVDQIPKHYFPSKMCDSFQTTLYSLTVPDSESPRSGAGLAGTFRLFPLEGRKMMIYMREGKKSKRQKSLTLPFWLCLLLCCICTHVHIHFCVVYAHTLTPSGSKRTACSGRSFPFFHLMGLPRSNWAHWALRQAPLPSEPSHLALNLSFSKGVLPTRDRFSFPGHFPGVPSPCTTRMAGRLYQCCWTEYTCKPKCR